MNTNTEVEWISKADAAARHGVPLRTVQLWAHEKKLRINGKLVALEDVAALASARNGASASLHHASAALAPRNALRPVSPSTEGEISATILRRFEAGVGPIDVSIELAVPLERVRALHAEWLRAREETSSGPSLADRFDALERKVSDLEDIARRIPSDLMDMIGDAGSRIVALEQRLAESPVPARSSFQCRCGARGYMGVAVKCTNCQTDQVWGHHPQRQ